MSGINISDVKISFGGTELGKIESDKVQCMGCRQNVKISDSEFCLWGSVHCHFCHRCLKIMKKINQEEGRTATPEDLKAV